MKKRLLQTRKSVKRLNTVQLLIMFECDDWKPERARASNDISDPTARAAIYNVDELSPRLEALHAERDELLSYIGDTLAIIEAIRNGLGDKFADACDWLYIDCMTARDIRLQHGVVKRTLYNRVDIACDWVDSIGVSKLLDGDYEL